MGGRAAINETVETGNWTAIAENRLAFPESVKPNGEKERVMIVIRRITLSHKVSGYTFWFSGQRRQGEMTFGDSRCSEKEYSGTTKRRYRPLEMRQELARMMGSDAADKLLNIAML